MKLHMTPLIAATLLLPAAGSAARAATPGAPVACPDPPLTGVLAHVTGGNTTGAEIREKAMRPDGYFHVDTPRLIQRLQALHANNYNYLIWNSPSDFDDLRDEFLPAAQKAGIKVWVYLVPPSESVKKASHPYKTDYEQWAKALAELGNQYPVLEAWEMDDFTFNPKFFSPDYVRKLQQTAHAINPHLRFFPVFQMPAVTDKWVADYGDIVDGVVAPYLDLPYINTQRTTSLDAQIDAAGALLGKKGKPLYVLVYAGRNLSVPLEPTPAYVASAMEICSKAMRENRLGGIVSYGTFLDPDAPATRTNHALDGAGRLSLSKGRLATREGDSASASQVIHVDPNSPRYRLSFWHHDQSGPGDTRGLFAKEVLIDDKVIWRADPAGDPRDTWFDGGALEGAIDLTDTLKGKTTAVLTFRLTTLKANGGSTIDVAFDRVTAAGFSLQDGGFETGQGWTVTDSGGALMAAVDRYDARTPAHVFDAVSQAFAAFAPKADQRAHDAAARR